MHKIKFRMVVTGDTATYGLASVPSSVFKLIDPKYVISRDGENVKYMCANSKEAAHLESLGIEASRECDYYKVKLSGSCPSRLIFRNNDDAKLIAAAPELLYKPVPEEIGFINRVRGAQARADGHTPGPWVAVIDINYDHFEIRDKNGRRIAVCPMNYPMSAGTHDANAKLIAEAPSMLDAIKEAVEWIEDDRFDDDYITGEWYHKMKNILSRLGL